MFRRFAKSFIIVTATLLAAVAVLSQDAVADSTAQTIKIGVIIPLSGEMASHGLEIQRAMQLALRELPEPRPPLKLIFEDSRLDAKTSVSAAKRLIDMEKVDAIVTLWPPTAEVVAPLTERAGILHYTISWDPALAKRFSYLLSHQVMVNTVVGSTLQLLKDKNAHRIAFLHMAEAGFNLGAKNVVELAESFGIEIVSNEAFPGDSTDFRSLIDRVLEKEPDAIVIWAVAPSLDILMKQLELRHPKALITGYFDYASDLAAFEGREYISEMYASDAFDKSFLSAYGVRAVSKGANAYDIVKLLAATYGKFPNRKPSAAEMKRSLLEVRDFHGAVGVFSIDPDGNSFYSPVRRQIRSGERILLGGGR